MIFYRFGDIPEDECSSIWNNNDEVIGKEKGVSVYEAHKNINGEYTPVIPFPTNEKAFNDFIYHIRYFTGNKYLVTGDLLDETGTDGEPLIKNVKIIKKLQLMKSIFSMFAYWDRVHQFPDGHIKVENNLAWRRKHMHVRSSNKQIPFQRMKKETRNVVVLDWEDKIKLQQSIRDLEEVAETYQRPCKELTGINNTLYYLKTIEEEINQRMSLKKK